LLLFDFLPNFHENSKRVTAASKLVSRNVPGLLFIVSGQIHAITKTFSNSDKPISPVGLRQERRFPSQNTLPRLQTPATRLAQVTDNRFAAEQRAETQNLLAGTSSRPEHPTPITAGG
jgi:hypothetical protein